MSIIVGSTEETMEANIRNEMPLPMPLSVMRSPIHIRSAVPAVQQMPIVAYVRKFAFVTASSPNASIMLTLCTSARPIPT